MTSNELSVTELLRDPFPDLSLWNDLTSSHRNPVTVRTCIILQRLRERSGLLWPHLRSHFLGCSLKSTKTKTSRLHMVDSFFFHMQTCRCFIQEGDPFPGWDWLLRRSRREAAPLELPKSVSDDLKPNRTPTMATSNICTSLSRSLRSSLLPPSNPL